MGLHVSWFWLVLGESIIEFLLEKNFFFFSWTQMVILWEKNHCGPNLLTDYFQLFKTQIRTLTKILMILIKAGGGTLTSSSCPS